MVTLANLWPPSVKPCLTNPPEGTVGIVLPIRDNLKFFKLAFHSILDFTDHRFMLTLVDNMSGFSTRQYLESIRRNHAVNVLQYQQPHAQGAEWNLGLRFMFAFAAVQYGVVLTPDVVMEPYWLSRMVKAMADGDYGTPDSNDIGDGFCMAFKRSAYERLGGFNETLPVSRPAIGDFIDRAVKAGFHSFYAHHIYIHRFMRSGGRPESAADVPARQEVSA